MDGQFGPGTRSAAQTYQTAQVCPPTAACSNRPGWHWSPPDLPHPRPHLRPHREAGTTLPTTAPRTHRCAPPRHASPPPCWPPC
ncbi:hypothetical protein [Streptomyces sp. TLI_171]|uniref:hypothetical protein n=1 Tax=Streptomyces sp. TLI_171 TaxID=1938859 RepID=UPI0037D9A164